MRSLMSKHRSFWQKLSKNSTSIAPKRNFDFIWFNPYFIIVRPPWILDTCVTSNKKYLARAVKGGDLRSSADSAWVRIPQILLFNMHNIILSDIYHFFSFNECAACSRTKSSISILSVFSRISIASSNSSIRYILAMLLRII